MSEEVSDSEEKKCPTCGAAIPGGAPLGLCPKCVLSGAAEPDEVETVVMGRGEPPSLERVAAAFPKLEVLELIGWGGMGAVFKARQPHLDRLVALKIMDERCAELPSFTERFTREGRVLAKLNHPNIVGIHDFGESGGFYFLLMEYVDGVNLRQAMRAGRFTPGQALAVVPNICEALQFAHDAGILHRDIKPENILLDAGGQVKIVDFGIAKMLDAGGRGMGMTLTGTSVPGTPHYMAPEQIEKPGDIDHRADIYSLGVVLYEMLTGELPLGRFAAPSEKAAVDARIDEIVFRTLEKERSMRQQSVTEVRTQVEEAGNGSGGIGGGEERKREKMERPKAVGSGKEAVRLAGRSSFLLSTGFVLLILCGLALFVAQVSEFEQVRSGMEWRHDMSVMGAQLSQLERKARLAEQQEAPQASALREELVLLAEQVDRLEKDGTPSLLKDDHFWLITFPMGVGFVLGMLGIGCLFWATMMGWEALRRLRESGARRGRGAAGFVAMLLPILILDALIFLVMIVPVRGEWEGPAISLSIILVVAVDIWIIKTLVRWMADGPIAAEGADEDFGGEPNRGGWVPALIGAGLVVVGIVILTLFVGRISVVFAALLVLAVVILMGMAASSKNRAWACVVAFVILGVGAMVYFRISHLKQQEMLARADEQRAKGVKTTSLEKAINGEVRTHPGDFYLVSYFSSETGAGLLKSEKFGEALHALRKAEGWLREAAERYPTWNPELVNRRLDIVRKMIAEARAEGKPGDEVKVEIEERAERSEDGPVGGGIRPLGGKESAADELAVEVTVRPGFEMEIVPVVEAGKRVTVYSDETWRKFGIGEAVSTHLDFRLGAEGGGLEVYDGKRSEWIRWTEPDGVRWEVGRLDGEMVFGGDGFAVGDYHEVVAFSGKREGTGERYRILLRTRVREFAGGESAPDAGSEEPEETSEEVELASVQPAHDEKEPGTFIADVFVREGFKMEVVAELETGSGKRIEAKALSWKKAATDGPVRERLRWRPGSDEPGGIEFIEGGTSRENWWAEAKGVVWRRGEIGDLRSCRNNGWEVGEEERMLVLWGKRDGDESVFRFSLKMVLSPIYTDG